MFIVHTFQLSAIIAFINFQVSHAQLKNCEKVSGGPGNNRTNYLPSVACKCSGNGGCDSVQFKGYSSSKYAELVISDQSGRRFEQQPTLTWQRAGVRPSTNSSKQLIATTRYAGRAPWQGFGAGLSDSAAVNLDSMTGAAKSSVLNEYFNTETGNDYSLVRTNIGTSTYSTHPYTYDDTNRDFNMDNFNLTSEDTELKMPILNEIKKLSDIELIGALWTGPTWLKSSGLENSGKIVKNKPTENENYQNALVQYLAKYVETYQAAGFKFWGISPLNEPVAAINGDFPNTQWGPTAFAKFLYLHMAPYFQKNFPGVEIISNENGKVSTLFWMLFLADIQAQIANNTDIDTGVIDNVKYFGIHSLKGDVQTPNFATRLIEVVAENFHPISTETEYALSSKYSANDYLGSWTVAEAYARNMIDDINVNSSAFLDWNMVLDSRGGPSWVGRYSVPSIMADPVDNDVFYKNPSFYVIGHFSKLIKKGWNARKSKVKFNGPHHSGLDVAIMESPGLTERVAVIHSRYTIDVDVNYYDKDLKKEVPFTVPAKSISTLYYSLI